MTLIGFSLKLHCQRDCLTTQILIDKIFTYNVCKPHKSDIVVTPISDHLMQFCVVKGNYKTSNDLPKYCHRNNKYISRNYRSKINK